MLKITHISDIHLSKITVSPFQFFSKRFIANFNLLLFRKKFYHEPALFSLPSIFQKLDIQYLITSGDLTSSSQIEEFTLAKDLFNQFDRLHIDTFTIPGNHDKYIKKELYKKTFYRFFKNSNLNTSSPISNFSLEKDGVEAKHLKDAWWIIGLDTTTPTSLFSSTGLFSETTEKNLLSLLTLLPKNAKIILVNHFPFTNEDAPKKRLLRSESLKKILQQHPSICLYLHGHTHRHSLVDFRKAKNLPISIDSGCSTHKHFGAFNLLEITSSSVKVSVYNWQQNEWIKTSETHFSL